MTTRLSNIQHVMLRFLVKEGGVRVEVFKQTSLVGLWERGFARVSNGEVTITNAGLRAVEDFRNCEIERSNKEAPVAKRFRRSAKLLKMRSKTAA